MKIRNETQPPMPLLLSELPMGETFRLTTGNQIMIKSEERYNTPARVRCVYLGSGRYKLYHQDREIVRVKGEFICHEV